MDAGPACEYVATSVTPGEIQTVQCIVDTSHIRHIPGTEAGLKFHPMMPFVSYGADMHAATKQNIITARSSRREHAPQATVHVQRYLAMCCRARVAEPLRYLAMC